MASFSVDHYKKWEKEQFPSSPPSQTPIETCKHCATMTPPLWSTRVVSFYSGDNDQGSILKDKNHTFTLLATLL